MPLPKARKGSGKKARQRVVGKVMHELKHSGKKRPRKQRIAIALKQAGLSRRSRRK
jgi:hypothetical protein